jgi:hypothetical protein
MDANTISLGVLGLAVIGFIFRDIVKSPKESYNDLSARVTALETNHTSMAVEQGKQAEATDNLADAIRELKEELRYMRQGHQNGRSGGERLSA